MLMKKKVIVTGATGFIGTALCKRLEQDKEYSIIKITRAKNIQGYLRVNSYQDSPAGDILIHLAEDSDRARVNKVGDIYRQNTGKVIEELLRKKYNKIIYGSSSIVYGDKGTEPYSENSCTYSTDIYSKSKLENEQRVLNAGGIVVRFSNIIGPGMLNNNILLDVFKQLSETSPITIQNSKPIRDFVYIDDAVASIVELMNCTTSEIFNVGTSKETSIYQLTKQIMNFSKQKNREIRSIITDAEYSYNVLNIGKIRNKTKRVPKFTLEQSINNIINSI